MTMYKVQRCTLFVLEPSSVHLPSCSGSHITLFTPAFAGSLTSSFSLVEDIIPFATDYLFWTSSDICLGFQSQSRFPHLPALSPAHERFLRLITVRNSSCGEVVFTSVCQEFCPRGGGGGVHGGGHVWQGVCMVGGCVWQGMHGGGCVWQGVCMTGGHMWWGGMHDQVGCA